MTVSLMDKIEKLQNSSFGDVVEKLRERIRITDPIRLTEALERMNHAQFIELRLGTYFKVLEKSVVAGCTFEMANEIALQECLAGLDEE